MKKSSKLKLSDNNHKLYCCHDEEIFEMLYLHPYELLSMINSKKLCFGMQEQTSNSDALSLEAAITNVTEIDSQTLV